MAIYGGVCFRGLLNVVHPHGPRLHYGGRDVMTNEKFWHDKYHALRDKRRLKEEVERTRLEKEIKALRRQVRSLTAELDLIRHQLGPTVE